jgi:dihydropteroate synthase
MHLDLGDRRFDITTEAIVVGILNRTPDSFYDQGEFWNFDAFLRLAEQHVNAGADILDVGGVKAGPGPEVTEQEELERVLPAIEALSKRFNTAISVDTWRASVAKGAYELGAVIGNDISGFGDPDYLPAAAAAGATVIATHIRLKPRVADPEPVYDDVVAAAIGDTVAYAERAVAAGVSRESVVIDPAHDFGKNTFHSLELTRRLDEMVATGWPVLVSLSNKDFVGETLDLPVGSRLTGTLAATAVCALAGARIYRVHEVVETRQTVDMVSTIAGRRPPTRAIRGLQ